MTTRRVSRERLNFVAALLTPRDRAMVEMLGRVRIATGNQLRRATMGDDSEAAQRAARRELQRLVRWRVVARLERRQGGLGRGSDAWSYALDVAGQRLLATSDRPRRPDLPGQPMWAHALTGAEIYTRLVEATRGAGRQLTAWHGEPTCWRDYPGPYGEQRRLKPDALMAVTGADYDDVSFLEVDMGSQSRTIIRAKLAAYCSYAATGQEQAAQGGVFPLTVFVTTHRDRQAVLLDLVRDLPGEASRMFAVGLISDASRLLMGGAS